MTNAISKRLSKFVEIAHQDRYTKEELEILGKMLLDAGESQENRVYEQFRITGQYSSDKQFDYYELRDAANSVAKYDGYTMDRDSIDPEFEEYKKLNFLEYTLTYYRKIFLFLVCVPYSNTALYINHPVLKSFVEWRIAIHK